MVLFFTHDCIIKTKIEALTDELSECLESLLENCFRTVNFDEDKQVSSTFNFALKIVSRLEEYSKHKLIRFAIRFLKGFKVINLDEVLLGYQHGDIKQIVIDFLFELKDNLSFIPSDLGESMEVVYEVMGFLFGHNLEPSKELKERYSESDINNNLKFPDYEDGPKQIGMSKKIYYDMIKRCIKRGAFNFYFHSTLNIDSVYGNNGKLNFILKGHFDENKLIGVGYTLCENGEFFYKVIE